MSDVFKPMIVKLGQTPLRTDHGEVQFSAWYDGSDEIHMVHLGDLEGESAVPLRMHSSCITAHYFQSTDCDCREQFDIALKKICSERRGVIVVLNHQAKANGILATLAEKHIGGGKLNSSDAFECLGLPRDNRSYLSVAFLIKELGIESVELLSNNPKKAKSLLDAGVEISSKTTVVADISDRPDLALHLDGKRRSEGHEF